MTADLPARPFLDGDRLAAGPPGLRVEVVAAAPSTNALVAERARSGAAEGLVVVAEHQTSGRGRLDRSWETPDRAALTFSVLLRPRVAPVEWPWLPLMTGYAVCRALREAGFEAGVKWPNDVLIGDPSTGSGRGGKVAGILVERVETGAGPAAVVGVGINVSTTREELPIEAATSLAIEAGAAPDRTDILLWVLGALREEYDAWQAGGAATLHAAYLGSCVTVGRDVQVALPGGGALTGRATGIDPGGRLTVSGPEGEVSVGAGDVVHVRSVNP
ncbi:biotin--[acetyl-CoA-carboxylase] ligase [Nocardioides koreensis]|uniref:biotin--[biotin carboxyl-carrier protein] ligase n=1 Tax=Nocardioides koreensis TaxID=433651 RepID=A0ABN2Z1U8_9ACTN